MSQLSLERLDMWGEEPELLSLTDILATVN
jgi:hypothetical protein